MSLPEETGQEPSNRWQLIGEVLAFQFKLLLDGLRDVVFSPLSLFAVLFGLLTDRRNPAKYFRGLLRFGRKSEIWINLFGTYGDGKDRKGADHLVRRAETFIVDEYNKRSMLQRLKSGVDKLMDRIPVIGAPPSTRRNKDE